MDDSKKLTIDEVREKNRIRLMAIDGVQDLGIDKRDGTDCIVIFVSMGAEYLKEKLPQEIEGYPVVIQMMDEIKITET